MICVGKKQAEQANEVLRFPKILHTCEKTFNSLLNKQAPVVQRLSGAIQH